MKRIISFLLSFILICTSLASPVFAFDSVSIDCSYDSYTEDNMFQTKDFKKSEVLLCGKVYNREAILKFDISTLKNADFKGCILEFWVRNVKAETKILFYDKNDNPLTTLSLDKKGLIKCNIDITSHVKELIQMEDNELFIKIMPLIIDNADSEILDGED